MPFEYSYATKRIMEGHLISYPDVCSSLSISSIFGFFFSFLFGQFNWSLRCFMRVEKLALAYD